MEVQTRLPPSPGGPRYSPITPEAGTPAARTASPALLVQGDLHRHNQNVQQAVDGADTTTTLNAPGRIHPSKQSQLGDFSATMNVEYSQQPATNGRPDLDGTDFDPFNHIADVVRAAGPGPSVEEPQEPQEPQLPPFTDDAQFTGSAVSGNSSDLPKRVQAFAKLEFPDGQFYMNTYAIELGRDRDAARKAERIMYEEACRKINERTRKDTSNPDIESVSQSAKLEAEMSAHASVVSGGIMHIDADETRMRRRKRRQRSQTSPTRGLSRLNQDLKPGQTNYQALANASLIGAQDMARPVDLNTMMPSPDECPLLPIHPAGDQDNAHAGHKGISRRHVKISYNPDRGLWELHVLGKNGCFVGDEYLGQYDVQALASGDHIQIGGVSLRFLLPNVPDGETGTEYTADLRSDAVSQSAISYDFEDGMGEHDEDDMPETPTTDNEDDRYRQLRLEQKAQALEDDDDEDDDSEEDENVDGESDMEVPLPTAKSKKSSSKQQKASKRAKEKEAVQKLPKIKLKLSLKKEEKPVEDNEQPIKRKGPGRPPKNGIMSKREEAELKRKEKEAAKSKKTEETSIKVEETEDVVETPASPTDKRKAQKKKKEEPEAEPAVPEEPAQVIQSIEKTELEPTVEPPAPAAPKPVKDKRPPKPPRSPSPGMKEEDYTPEQLAKPTQSYVVLIHEALTNRPEKKMTLPQIYRAIERRYPHYRFRTSTLGWQSSVRHNLSQHPAFVRIERDGKGWMWGLDPNISIEREKKRRPSPPPMQTPGMYSTVPGMFGRNYPANGYMSTGPNGQPQMPQNPYAMWPNSSQQGQAYPPANQAPRPPFNASGTTTGTAATYHSPYDANRANSQQQQNAGTARPPAGNQPAMPNAYLHQNRPGQPGATPQSASGSTPAPQQGQITSAAAHANVQAPGPQGNVGVPGTAGAASAISPPPPANNPFNIPPGIWNATRRFRDVLVKQMAALPHVQEIVDQGIHKCLGLRPPAVPAFQEFPAEVAIIKALSKMLKNINWPIEEKIAFANGQQPSSQPPPSPATNAGHSNPQTQVQRAPSQTAPTSVAQPSVASATTTRQQPGVNSIGGAATVATTASTKASETQQMSVNTAAPQSSLTDVNVSQSATHTGVGAQAPSQPETQANSRAQAQASSTSLSKTEPQGPTVANGSQANVSAQPTEQAPPVSTSTPVSGPAHAPDNEMGHNAPAMTASTSGSPGEQSLKRARSPGNAGPGASGSSATGEPSAKREKLET